MARLEKAFNWPYKRPTCTASKLKTMHPGRFASIPFRGVAAGTGLTRTVSPRSVCASIPPAMVAHGPFVMALAQLRYLVAIADSGLNITLAAERVHATQPELSKQLRQLEEEHGFQLFLRRGKSLDAVARAGQHVLERARTILAEAANVARSPPTCATGRAASCASPPRIHRHDSRSRRRSARCRNAIRRSACICSQPAMPK